MRGAAAISGRRSAALRLPRVRPAATRAVLTARHSSAPAGRPAHRRIDEQRSWAIRVADLTLVHRVAGTAASASGTGVPPFKVDVEASLAACVRSGHFVEAVRLWEGLEDARVRLPAGAAADALTASAALGGFAAAVRSTGQLGGVPGSAAGASGHSAQDLLRALADAADDDLRAGARDARRGAADSVRAATRARCLVGLAVLLADAGAPPGPPAPRRASATADLALRLVELVRISLASPPPAARDGEEAWLASARLELVRFWEAGAAPGSLASLRHALETGGRGGESRADDVGRLVSAAAAWRASPRGQGAAAAAGAAAGVGSRGLSAAPRHGGPGGQASEETRASAGRALLRRLLDAAAGQAKPKRGAERRRRAASKAGEASAAAAAGPESGAASGVAAVPASRLAAAARRPAHGPSIAQLLSRRAPGDGAGEPAAAGGAAASVSAGAAPGGARDGAAEVRARALAAAAELDGSMSAAGIRVGSPDRLRLLRLLDAAGRLDLLPLAVDWPATAREEAGHDGAAALLAVCEACRVQDRPGAALLAWTEAARASAAPAGARASVGRTLAPATWTALVDESVRSRQWRVAASLLRSLRQAAAEAEDATGPQPGAPGTGRAARRSQGAQRAGSAAAAAASPRDAGVASARDLLCSPSVLRAAAAATAAMRDWPAGVDALLAACDAAAGARGRRAVARASGRLSRDAGLPPAAADAFDDCLDAVAAAGAPASVLHRVCDRALATAGHRPAPRHAVRVLPDLVAGDDAKKAGATARLLLAAAERGGAGWLERELRRLPALDAATALGRMLTASGRKGAPALEPMAGAFAQELAASVEPWSLRAETAAAATARAASAAGLAWAAGPSGARVWTEDLEAPEHAGGASPLAVQAAAGVVSALLRGVGRRRSSVSPAGGLPDEAEEAGAALRRQLAAPRVDVPSVAGEGRDARLRRPQSVVWTSAMRAWYTAQAARGFRVDDGLGGGAPPAEAVMPGAGQGAAARELVDPQRAVAQSWFDDEVALVTRRSAAGEEPTHPRA